jgi:hypothetical protein
MSSTGNYKEEMTGQAGRLSGKPDSDRNPRGIESNLQDLDMHMAAPATQDLDDNGSGGKMSMMMQAVKHLNRETQRGEHAPMVGGYEHNPKMGR